jgi:ABC-type branched-subunit amino acid transport system substrate-binding protein
VAGWGEPATVTRVTELARTTGAKLFLPAGWADVHALVAAAPLDGRLFLVDDFPDPRVLGPAAERFVRAYRAAGGKADVRLALSGYLAAGVILDAIARAGAAGNQRAAVLREIRATHQGAGGVLGEWWFDEKGDPTPAKLAGHALVGGVLQPVERLEVRR